MMNYKIWTNNDDSRELIIEIYNKKDVHEVQKIFVDKNYIIEELWYCSQSAFIRIYFEPQYDEEIEL